MFVHPGMLKWGREHMGNNVLMLDTMFRLNKLGYSLLTPLVVDNHGVGLPVLFAIMKKEDQAGFAQVLRAMDTALNEGPEAGNIKPDKCEAERNAARYVLLHVSLAPLVLYGMVVTDVLLTREVYPDAQLGLLPCAEGLARALLGAGSDTQEDTHEVQVGCQGCGPKCSSVYK